MSTLPRLIVRPSLLPLIALIYVVGCISRCFAQRDPRLDWACLYGVGAALAYLLCLVAHEGAHALTGHLTGRRVAVITLAAVPRVTLDPEEAHGWHQALVSASGPLAEATTGLLLARSEMLTATWMAGWFAILNAAWTLLVPLTREGDGRKFWRGVLQGVGARF